MSPTISHSLRPLPDVGFRVAIESEDSDPISRAIEAGCYTFTPSQLFLYQLMKSGERVVDLGAHIGTFSLGAAALGCHVLAVEAAPQNVRLLRASVAQNGFDRVQIVSAAATDHRETLRFAANGPFGQVCRKGYSGPSIEVPAVTLDGLLEEIGWDRVQYLKVDIEGEELSAFRGMARLLSSPEPPIIVYESNGHILEPYDLYSTHLIAALEGFGYRSYAASDGILRPVRPWEIQILTVVDYIAVKDPPGVEAVVARIPGWRIAPPCQLEEKVEQVVLEAAVDIQAHRAYLGGALARADTELLCEPRVQRVIESLALDESSDVRAAALRAKERSEISTARRTGKSEAESLDLRLRLKESLAREVRLVERTVKAEEVVENALANEHELGLQIGRYAEFHRAVTHSTPWKLIQLLRRLVGREW